MTAQRRCPTNAQVFPGPCPLGRCALLVAVFFLPIGPGQLFGGDAPKLPPPQELSGRQLISSDGLRLSATFYPGDKGKETVPVILLHMFKGDRKEYAELAPALQKQGCAVLAPDLRGHGESNQYALRNQRLDAAKMSAENYSFMRYDDMERFRRFLVEKNDAGELNLNKLCIVGAEMGASVAAYYAFFDWTTPRREADRAAPSRDVKGLILISPDWNFPGMPLNKPLSNPLVGSQISVMIVAGKENSRSFSDARRAYKLLERFHRNETERRLFFGALPTSLQGTKILGVRGLNLEQAIATFIERQLADQSYPWYRRGKAK